MYVRELVDECGSNWRQQHEADFMLPTLLSFLFQTVDALYCAVKNFPDTWTKAEPVKIVSGGTQSMYIRFNAGPDALFMQKSAISLTGDIWCILKRLNKEKLFDLEQPVSALIDLLDEFRDLRNFYAHLDERLSDLKNNGFTGSCETGCGIRYENAKECFHMILVGNTFYYTSQGKCLKKDIGKRSFRNVLHLSLDILRVLSKDKGIPIEQIYKV
ncbi:hypothetical protein [Pseudomonas sp. AP42]|uniref:hypothetical protein n=1 Tax=Pseudomonas sp. AP42 TaxID=1535632 RepID=UPI00084B03D8|nr:hypothetical protein [Pseudomonas sp. AP42]OEC58377.1 hypothetical protein A7K61_21270 [Pseudomonas sp. AP42]